MEDSSPPTPDLRANLVAYLDGELDEVATVEVEKTLTESEEIRLEVEALSKTWELLDALPPVQASSHFTERTLQSIQTESLPDAARPLLSPAGRRSLLRIILMLGLVSCAVLGFYLANRAVPKRSEGLLRDLPVIENLDLYEEAGDVEFLRDLQGLGPLTNDPSSEFQHENE